MRVAIGAPSTELSLGQVARQQSLPTFHPAKEKVAHQGKEASNVNWSKSRKRATAVKKERWPRQGRMGRMQKSPRMVRGYRFSS